MATRHFRVLGQTLIYPKGLRKSPGSNNRARCMANELHGKGGKAGFLAASDQCKGQTGGGKTQSGTRTKSRLYRQGRSSPNWAPF